MRSLHTGATTALLLGFVATAYAQDVCGKSRARPRSFDDASVPYAQRLADAVKFNLIDPGSVQSSSVAEVEVISEPSGAVASFKLMKAEGSALWEIAVLRALAKTDCLPLDAMGKVPAKLYLVFRP